MVPNGSTSFLLPEVIEVYLPQSLLHLLYFFLHLNQLFNKLASYLIYLVVSSTVLLFVSV